MEKILITGGAGFIASSLAEKILSNREDLEVVLIDNLLTGDLNNIPDCQRCHFYNGDVNNFNVLAAIMRKYHFDYVFHFAAVVGVKRTTENPILVLEDIKGIENILKLSYETKVKKVFYSSSSEIYGEPVSLPQHEYETPLNSRLPYAVVKNIGESYFRSYQQELGLDYTIFRFFNTYGPKQSADFVMSKFIRSALKQEDLTIYGDGNQFRTFCYIDDNIETCTKCLFNNVHNNDVINVGSEKIVTINELAHTILELTGSKSKIVHLPPLKEGDMTARQPNNEKMKNLIGHELVPLDVGISKVVEQFKRNYQNS